MSTSDKLAILTIVVPAIISLIALYFQFLRKTQTINITMLDWYLENVQNSESILLLKLSFANSGNQTIIISKISLIFERNKEKCLHIIKEGNNDPLVLRPSDVRQENYRFACSENHFSFILDQDPNRREIKSIIHFEIIDSKGKHYEKDVHGCIVKVENFKACGTSYIRNAQVELLK
jgi:hypothetical protein